jgi:hypothetical protein
MSNLEETVVEKQLDESEISLLKAFLLAEEQAKKDVAIDEAGFFTVENDVLVEGSGLNYYYMNKARKILIEERILQMVFG